MAANVTSLSRIARQHAIGLDDGATDALAFTLEHSEDARSTFANFLIPMTDRAVKQMVDDGWANTDGLLVGTSEQHYRVRYLRLAGAYACFGVHYDEAKRSNRPLWLVFGNFGGNDPAQVTTEQVRQRLASLAPSESVRLEGFGGAFCIPIALLPGGDNAIVAQLTDIARLINPDGPIYNKDAPNA